MKKIIAFLLISALCIPALFSCQSTDGSSVLPSTIPTVENPNNITPLEAITNMYKISQPTKVVASTTQTIIEDVLVLECSYEVVTGYVDGHVASVFKSETQEVRSIEEGGQNDEIKPLIKTTSTIVEAIEGLGTRTDGGDWYAEGEVSSIGRGKMAIKLEASLLKEVKYENHVLTFVIPKANASKVLGSTYGKYVDSDIAVTIKDDGAVVTSVEFNYYLEGDTIEYVGSSGETEKIPTRSAMRVLVNYSYDIEKITIE